MNSHHTLAVLLLLLPLSAATRAQVPPMINYQGRVIVAGTNFTGTGQFQFALINGNGSQTYWSNGTGIVSAPVTKGLYALLLGDTNITNMAGLPATVFQNPDVRLRVWFDDGVNGLRQLSPDQRLVAVGYAMMAANVPDGAITSNKLAAASVTGAALAPGSVTAAAIADGGISSAQLASNLTINGTLTAAYLQGDGTGISGVITTQGLFHVGGLRWSVGQPLPGFDAPVFIQVISTNMAQNAEFVYARHNELTGKTNIFNSGWDVYDIDNPSFVTAAYKFWTGISWGTVDSMALFVDGSPLVGRLSYGNRVPPYDAHHFFVGGGLTNRNTTATVEIQQMPATNAAAGLRVTPQWWGSLPWRAGLTVNCWEWWCDMTASNDPSLTLAFRANDDGGQILWPVMKVLTNRTIDWTRCAAWLNPPTNGWLFGRLSVSSNGVLVGGNITNINLAGHFSITTNDVGCLTISPAGFSGVVSNSGHYLRYEGGILVSTNWP